MLGRRLPFHPRRLSRSLHGLVDLKLLDGALQEEALPLSLTNHSWDNRSLFWLACAVKDKLWLSLSFLGRPLKASRLAKA